MKRIILIFLILISLCSQSLIAWGRVNPVPMATNSKYPNGINDTCGGCVSPAVCGGSTCGAACGASVCVTNQACLSGSCISTLDLTSCYPTNNGCPSTSTCGGGGWTGVCACSSGIYNDDSNCGACGNACTGLTAYCSYGFCIDANLCGHGGCTGTRCAGINIGSSCTDGNIYAGGNLEVSTGDPPLYYADAVQYCQNLGAGWSLPTIEQLKVLYDNKSSIGMSSSIYWSSSQLDPTKFFIEFFSGGSSGTVFYNSNYGTSGTRCVKNL
ncbi:MAG: hypothetical protein WCH62_04450 [Candidatus Omnitrophota bacterium]